MTSNLLTELPKAQFTITLAKYVSINYAILIELKSAGMSGSDLAVKVSEAIGTSVNESSLAVALSRAKNKLTLQSNSHSLPLNITDEFTPRSGNRFVPKSSILVLSSQEMTLSEKDPKSGYLVKKTKQVDWRGLQPNETISSWVYSYKQELSYLNKVFGYRWSQIASAISNHLGLTPPLTQNSLSSILCLINQGCVPKNTKKSAKNY